MNEHDGHRQRILDKFTGGEVLEQHELLEILLFNALPRVNTNPIAHALIERFSTLRGVFEASVKELCEVKGVGAATAAYLRCVGECASLAYGGSGVDTYAKSYGDFKKIAEERLRGKTSEVLEFYFTDKTGKVFHIESHTDSDLHRVTLQTGALSELVAKYKPFGMCIAHNHLTGSCEPSPQDDRFTEVAQTVCSLSGTILYDHCIYAGEGKVYSYFSSGAIDGIKERFDFNKMIKDTRKK